MAHRWPHNRFRARAALLIATAFVAAATFPAAADPGSWTYSDGGIGRVCDLIAQEADANHLPRAFFARLIWKESRFDAEAVSPAGAEGIAQFMPGTARLRGLGDAFDVAEALPASAAYLAALRASFGNLGLAAAAYNAGENRVSRWLAAGGFLPIETEDYVLDILGEPVDRFANKAHRATILPLSARLPFGAACRNLPAIMSATVPMAHIRLKPWGIQVAGNFRRASAIAQWQRLKARFSALQSYEPVISRVRTPMGRRGIYAVRIGADSRPQAGAICKALHQQGGSCVVLKNR